MPLISLNEAITCVMREPARTPEGEHELFRQAIAEMCSRGKDCLELIARQGEGHNLLRSILGVGFPFKDGPVKGWPAQLTWPPHLVLETLGTRSPDWPPPLQALFEAAASYADYLEKYLKRYEQALIFLLGEGREGRIRFYGQRHTHVRPMQIPAIQLIDGMTIDDDRRNLVPDASRLSQRRNYGPTFGANDPDYPPTYYNVMLESADVAALVSDELQLKELEANSTTGCGNVETAAPVDVNPRRRDPSNDELMAWYLPDKDRLQQLSEQEQTEELRKRFGPVKDARDVLRALIKDNPAIKPSLGRRRRKPGS